MNKTQVEYSYEVTNDNDTNQKQSDRYGSQNYSDCFAAITSEFNVFQQCSFLEILKLYHIVKS